MDDVQSILGSDEAAWVFDHNITWEDDVWKADPFDSPEIHEEARAQFAELLKAVTAGSNQAQSRILMFQGQSGAGKTHLIRALRASTHNKIAGYFGYAQMTPDISNYADYFLRRLINSLEKPYNPEEPTVSGLMRLSNCLAEDAKVLSDEELHDLREREFEADGLAAFITDLADTIVISDAFAEQELDINIVRALLYLQRHDPRIDQRIRQYLYGRQLNELSSQQVAALDPNDGQDRAFEIIESLGRIMYKVDEAALIFCIDQVEDLRFYDDPEERFQKAVRDLIQIANRVPSAIILISCLDDFYFQMRDFLPQSFIDRIEKSRPLLLKGARSAEESKLILGRRLDFVASKEAPLGQMGHIDPVQVFGAPFFEEVAGLSTRRLLESAETRRKELCGIEVAGSGSPGQTAPAEADQFSINAIQQRWERFVLEYQAEIPDEDEEFVSVLTSALHASLEETDHIASLRIEPITSLEGVSAVDLQVNHTSGHNFDSRLFICNRRSQGGGLKRQIEKVFDALSGKSAVIVRSSDFPRDKRSATGEYLARFVAEGGRRQVIPTYEWERMVTLQQFCSLHNHETGFSAWLRAAQVLRDLPSIQKLLHLDAITEAPKTQVAQPAQFGSGPEPTPRPETAPVSTGMMQMPDAGAPAGVDYAHMEAQSGTAEMSDMTAAMSASANAPSEPFIPVSEVDDDDEDQDAAPLGEEYVMRENDDTNVHHVDFGNSGKRIHPEPAQKGILRPQSLMSRLFGYRGHSSEDDAELDNMRIEPTLPAMDETAGLSASDAMPPFMGNDMSGSINDAEIIDPIRVGRALGTANEGVSFSSSLLRRHAAVLGGSGSGKTTLALSIIEQLLMKDIPVVLIDRKGDLASYANPDVWQENPDDDPERRILKSELRDNIDVAVYTPGRISGRPISITLLPNGIADLPAHEQQELANVSAAALSDMLHLGNSATHQRQGGILTVGLRQLGAMSAREVTLADLIALLEDDYTDLVDETQRMDPSGKLRRDLVAQLDSLRHRNWALFEGGGEPLSMDSLLGRDKKSKSDKTRLSVVYTGFLGDNENILFWVAQFLAEALRFCQRNPNEELQAVIMFDEADLYIPANSKPATKEPLESLLKRARSAGIGLMLATQSPGDLDYKSRDQITSWFIGKVREDTALRKLKAAFSSETGIDPASALPNQKVGEFHMIQEGVVRPIKGDLSLVVAEQVPFDRIEDLSSGTSGKKPKKQLLFDFG